MIICAAGHRPRNGLGNTSGVTTERGRHSRGNSAWRLPAPVLAVATLLENCGSPRWFREKAASKFINMTQIRVYDKTLRHTYDTHGACKVPGVIAIIGLNLTSAHYPSTSNAAAPLYYYTTTQWQRPRRWIQRCSTQSAKLVNGYYTRRLLTILIRHNLIKLVV